MRWDIASIRLSRFAGIGSGYTRTGVHSSFQLRTACCQRCCIRDQYHAHPHFLPFGSLSFHRLRRHGRRGCNHACIMVNVSLHVPIRLTFDPRSQGHGYGACFLLTVPSNLNRKVPQTAREHTSQYVLAYTLTDRLLV